jgi:hypothetical protein
VSEEEKEEINSLRKIINTVINIIPEEKFECEVGECGRKFKSREELAGHISRRHNGGLGEHKGRSGKLEKMNRIMKEND